MIFLLAAVRTFMSSDDGKIDGAPGWAQEFLERIERRDAVRNEMEDQAHTATLNAINDLSGTVGQIAGSLARLEKRVEWQRQEIRSTRDKMSILEDELRAVHEQIDGLGERVQQLEGQVERLRETTDGKAAAPPEGS